MNLFDRWNTALADLRKQDRFRSFNRPQGLDFTSNDYLGYGAGRQPAPPGTAAPSPFAEGLSRSGMASRLLRGHHEVWERVEAELAAWHGAEAVLMMTSGYAANEGLLSTILEPGDWVATDELNHACIVDGLRLARCRRHSFRHNDLNHLEDGLKSEAAKAEPGRERFVITESLFSMDGDRAPLAEIVALAERYGAQVIVDEAHATGCFGATGAGLIDAAGVRGKVLASVHTGGKALGVPGAYIACSRLLKDYLINKCRHLIFTTALPAACGQWWLDMMPVVRADETGRAALHANSAHFRKALVNHGITPGGTEYVIPVVLGDNGRAVRAARQVQALGFDVRAIRPPSVPVGTARVRVSIHADHNSAILDQLAEALAAAVRSAQSEVGAPP
ncbi:8-amino-7-oxononanoate synthase [Fimbriiglobus ruber]|uniref:8-amino-7-oxononanoate synthase n=2 Tax=Fimbriiglobus ruber TaxID=1908690 RepID=A0A225DDV6_9BACT|nr:8-amino-7-oxononanoate synthase [Fimbriiglobus ruber]